MFRYVVLTVSRSSPDDWLITLPVDQVSVTYNPGLENPLELLMSDWWRQQFIILVTARNVNFDLWKKKRKRYFRAALGRSKIKFYSILITWVILVFGSSNTQIKVQNKNINILGLILFPGNDAKSVAGYWGELTTRAAAARRMRRGAKSKLSFLPPLPILLVARVVTVKYCRELEPSRLV